MNSYLKRIEDHPDLGAAGTFALAAIAESLAGIGEALDGSDTGRELGSALERGLDSAGQEIANAIERGMSEIARAVADRD